MEDVKVKGCPDPPTLEECLEELEKWHWSKFWGWAVT